MTDFAGLNPGSGFPCLRTELERLWEAHEYVFYVSGRLLGVPDFAGLNPGSGSPS